MPDLVVITAELAWPFAIALAWLAGEIMHRWSGVPRISVYGLVGFAVAQAFPELYTSDSSSPVTILANVAF
eukprot:gene32603-33375_t